MKKMVSLLPVIIIVLVLSPYKALHSLKDAPINIEFFNEIATHYNPHLAKLFNELDSAERIFVYYLYRAALPGNRIAADQTHRDALEIMALCEDIVSKSAVLSEQTLPFDVATFLSELQTYLVYLWTNHGQYFVKEHSHEKRSPARLGLTTFTQENVINVLQALGHPNAVELVERLAPSLFDATVEPTICVPNDIVGSACNLYAQDFTEDDFNSIPASERSCLNGYFYIEYVDGKRVPKVQRYSVGEKYSDELQVVCHWLKKAHEHAKEHPAHFDNHLVASLEYLIAFFQTGDEQWFKKHSIEWLKSNSRVDYVCGFIETYQDPKGYRGKFQAEVSIKSIDIKKLNAILPSLEAQLPFPVEFKRENLTDTSAIPNASINTVVVATGDLGPLQITAAYCLPNYSDIRATHGSKQVIYQSSQGLGELLNPDLSRKLFNLSHQVEWLNVNDPERELHNDLWEVHCILHETLGHGSGRLATHTFKEGENFTIGDVTHKVGDTIAVTTDNVTEFLTGYESALEELRAEILALYTSIFMFDDLAKAGLYKKWPERIGKQLLIEHLIMDMASTGFRRLLSQSEHTNEILGAHAQANTTILNYLVDHGGLEFAQEELIVDGTSHKVLGLKLTDLDKVLGSITALTKLVQHIKSTGDGIAVKKLIDTYGRYVRNPEHVIMLKNNWQALVGNLKVSARISPRLELQYRDGVLVDVAGTWPSGIVEQQKEFSRLALLMT